MRVLLQGKIEGLFTQRIVRELKIIVYEGENFVRKIGYGIRWAYPLVFFSGLLGVIFDSTYAGCE